VVTAPARRAVFLDRDGVLNESVVRDGMPYPPATPADVVIRPGVADACRRLEDAGWVLVVVTNQPDIARGTTSRAAVDAINAAVTAGLPIAEVVVCPHDDADACACRKPRPGMLVDAARRLNLDLTASVMVGDRWRDVEAGRAAGTRTIYVDNGDTDRRPDAPDHVVGGLPEAADLILRAQHRDDWDAHWSAYADVASDNPAQAYRRALILRWAGGGGPPARVLDIGSGQGDLLQSLRAAWPATELAGIEPSREGIRIARGKVPDARFFPVDLLQHTEIPPELERWAQVAVCSEVLEHVDEPARLLAAASQCIAPGGLLVVTVPGGPRTAFDRHIGHRRHYRPAALRAVLEDAGLQPQHVAGAGFPFFNCYKLVVLARGKGVIRAVAASEPPSRLAAAVMHGFRVLLRPSLNSSRLGWQLVATATPRPASP
jgi:D-glycero-D-manno-heptose 1,7-bisphosphate phosphatase